MPELKVEEVKKDLQGMVQKQKESIQKDKETLLSDTEKKAFEEKKAKEQDAQKQKEEEAKKDAAILAKKPEERTDEEKKRAEILEQEVLKREEAKLSTDEKIKRVQTETQKRIDEIKNELLQEKDKSSKQAQELQQKLQILEQENQSLKKQVSSPEKKDDVATILKQKENERLDKYLEEDKEKPRHERREMPKGELEEWLIDDIVAAQEWLADRSVRRLREKNSDINEIKRSQFFKNFTDKQNESNAKVLIRHPDLDTVKREKELKDAGKSNEEIQKTLCEENEKYRICSEIVKENPEQYLTKENGPELVAAEMEKRVAAKSSSTKTAEQERIEALEKKIEEQNARIAELESPPDTGINSTTQRNREAKEKLSEQENALVETLKSLNTPEDKIQSALKKFRERKGIKSNA